MHVGLYGQFSLWSSSDTDMESTSRILLHASCFKQARTHILHPSDSFSAPVSAEKFTLHLFYDFEQSCSYAISLTFYFPIILIRFCIWQLPWSFSGLATPEPDVGCWCWYLPGRSERTRAVLLILLYSYGVLYITDAYMYLHTTLKLHKSYKSCTLRKYLNQFISI